MIKLVAVDPSGKIHFEQGATSPIVYLDNWAIRRIGLDPDSSERFRKTLVSKGGTLALSWINLLEIAGLSNTEQLDALGDFLEKIMPHIIFIDPIPTEVIGRENEILLGGLVIGPHLDNNLMEYFAVMDRKSINPLSIKELIAVLKSPKVANKFREFREKFMAENAVLLEKVREKRRTNPKFASAVRRVAVGPDYQRATRYVYDEAINHLYRGDEAMTPNDWRDLFHTIVPISYCDLVLLDRRWVDVAGRVSRRLSEAGHKFETARVFSESETDEFWEALGNWQPLRK